MFNFGALNTAIIYIVIIKQFVFIEDAIIESLRFELKSISFLFQELKYIIAHHELIKHNTIGIDKSRAQNLKISRVKKKFLSIMNKPKIPKIQL